MTARQIARYFGSITAAAKRAGLARETLHRWHRSGVPREWQVWFEAISDGVLKATKESKSTQHARMVGKPDLVSPRPTPFTRKRARWLR